MFSLFTVSFLLHRLILVIYSLNYTEKAVDSARSARKKRWICFFICLVVLIIIAIVVAIVVVKNLPKKN